MLDDKDTITSRLICVEELQEVSNSINSLRLSSSDDHTRKTPLFYATRKGNLKVIKLLLTNGADEVKDNPALLNIAVQNNSLKIVDIFLQCGADINATDVNGRTALHTLLEGRVRINRNNRIARNKIVIFLLSNGANINARTTVGFNALHIAAESGFVKIVEALLDHNADVNSTTSLNISTEQDRGMTALHIACGEGHQEIVEVLLRYGAKIDSRTEMHMTPLHFAAKVPYPRVVRVLLKFGAGIDFRDKDGRTALHIAANKGCTKNVVTLLQHGADVNIESKYLDTPLRCFTDSHRSHRKIIKILKRHMLKMKIANLYVNEIDLLSITSFPSLQNKCKDEIASMKREKINNTIVSFYDLLTNDINRLAMYARNENIALVFTSDDYKIKFQLYASMIEGYFRKGKMRNELLEPNYRGFYFLLNSFPELPYLCTEKIIGYLGDEDLIVLIEAVCSWNKNW